MEFGSNFEWTWVNWTRNMHRDNYMYVKHKDDKMVLV
jgi:hypothetical protein